MANHMVFYLVRPLLEKLTSKLLIVAQSSSWARLVKNFKNCWLELARLATLSAEMESSCFPACELVEKFMI